MRYSICFALSSRSWASSRCADANVVGVSGRCSGGVRGGFGLLLLRSRGLVVVGIGGGIAVLVVLGVGGRWDGEGGGRVVEG